MDWTVKLNDGNSLSLIGLGVMRIPDEDVPEVMRQATTMGYRSFDTASIYGNEKGTGRGIRECGLPRDEVQVTTKLWNTRQGYDETLRAFDESLSALGLDYIDLFLIHWPVPTRGLYTDSWRALVRIRDEGRVKSIGVSNFLPEHLDRIIGETGVVPVLNQVELHPDWQQRALREVHAKHGIVAQAWSPLGHGRILQNPRLAALAAKVGCTVAQLILAYFTGQGIAVIPKASSSEHLMENIASLSVNLDAATIDAMRALDRSDGSFGPDPRTFETIGVSG